VKTQNCCVKLSDGMHLLPDGFLLLSLQIEQSLALGFALKFELFESGLLQLPLLALFSSKLISLSLQKHETSGVSVKHRNEYTCGATESLRKVERWDAPAV
jgi:hypothetical protein